MTGTREIEPVAYSQPLTGIRARIHGRARRQRTLTGGRPAELWTTAAAPGA